MKKRSLADKYYRLRSNYRRLQRLVCPSPAELRFVEIMGGKVFRFKKLRLPYATFPMAIVWSRGKFLKHERVRREVRCGRYWIDFANDIKRAIEVDGADYHLDIVADMDREIYLTTHGWRIMRVQAIKLWNNPDQVQRKVLNFLLHGTAK